jgi:hypothetical protein
LGDTRLALPDPSPKAAAPKFRADIVMVAIAPPQAPVSNTEQPISELAESKRLQRHGPRLDAIKSA